MEFNYNTSKMDANFKKLFTVYFLFIIPVVLIAQKDVTQFLGIPVDGSKAVMIEKLKSKGFTMDPNKDILVGQFNGTSVYVTVATNNKKVCRIAVSDVHNRNASDIKIRFNNLIQQFAKNEKYMASSLSYEEYLISNDEDIAYEMSVNNKRYQAAFYQLPLKIDTVALTETVLSKLALKYTEEQISNPTEELIKDLVSLEFQVMLDIYSKKSVWFMISESYGKYYISMFYDNEYNRADGEDL